MKRSKVYLIGGSICLVLAIVVLLFMTAYALPALVPALQPDQAQAAVLESRESDPLAGFNFVLELEGKLVGYFTECSGLGSYNVVLEQKIVDNQGITASQKIPGRLRWTNIILKRGITNAVDMWDWRRDVEDGNVNEARKNGSIIMLDQQNMEVARWDFVNGWPSSITVPNISAESTKYATEEIEIVHEGLTRVNQ